jgi:gelsolin
LDHEIKKAAAESEYQWKDINSKVDLKIWRIEKFVVVPWPRSKYGKFHTGDSYVVLNVFKEEPSNPKLSYDVHIWIGNER